MNDRGVSPSADGDQRAARWIGGRFLEKATQKLLVILSIANGEFFFTNNRRFLHGASAELTSPFTKESRFYNKGGNVVGSTLGLGIFNNKLGKSLRLRTALTAQKIK